MEQKRFTMGMGDFDIFLNSIWHLHKGPIAQSVERGANNATVAGSIPAGTKSEIFLSPTVHLKRKHSFMIKN
jgi:hypothetical protein